MLTKKLFDYMMEEAKHNPGWTDMMEGIDLSKCYVKEVLGRYVVVSKNMFTLSDYYRSEQEAVDALSRMREIEVLFI